MEVQLKSKTIGELRKVVKQLKIKQPRGCKKVELIRLIRKYIKETGEYKHVLVDLLNLDKNVYLSIYKRPEIFDSFSLKFDEDEIKGLEKLFTLEEDIKCHICGKYYKIEDKEEHIKKDLMIKRSKKKRKCIICGEYYNIAHLNNHISSRKHKRALLNEGNEEITEYETAYESRLRSYRINNHNNIKIPLDLLEEKRKVVIDKIREILNEFNGIKVNLKLFCLYRMDEEIQEFTFKTENQIILRSNDLHTFYDNAIDKLINESDEFVSKGSGWSLEEIRI
ncbi:hypothetical protein AVEN_9269-1 [Araneus ventricosus]|uniref:C2H2-type domain-containing protein n=1 Tax=Araneus ventricosus TaxID=182803 RepID=A0A4Y2UI91_ARAVE|nr:hypothetical protein AVEN_9269-1 [Araneus ventricosus]